MLVSKLIVATFFLAFISTNPTVKQSSDLIQKIVALDILKQFKDSPIFSILKDSIPIAGTLLTTFYIFYDMNKKDPNEVILNKLDEISTQIDKVSDSIESLNSRVVSEASRSNVITVMEKFIVKYSEITKAEHQFENIVNSYATNETALLENLVKFLKDQKKAFNEFTLVDYLSVKFIGFQSPVDELIHFGRNAEHGSSVPKTSSTKLIYDFHISLLTKVLHSFTIQELALELIFKLSGSRHDEDILSLENRKQKVTRKLNDSLKASLNKLSDENLKGYADLNIGSIKSYNKFKNVLQTYFEYEEKLSSTGSCTGKCSDFTRVSKNGYYCQGEARRCTQEETFVETTKTVLSWGAIYYTFGIPWNASK